MPFSSASYPHLANAPGAAPLHWIGPKPLPSDPSSDLSKFIWSLPGVNANKSRRCGREMARLRYNEHTHTQYKDRQEGNCDQTMAEVVQVVYHVKCESNRMKNSHHIIIDDVKHLTTSVTKHGNNLFDRISVRSRTTALLEFDMWWNWFLLLLVLLAFLGVRCSADDRQLEVKNDKAWSVQRLTIQSPWSLKAIGGRLESVGFLVGERVEVGKCEAEDRDQDRLLCTGMISQVQSEQTHTQGAGKTTEAN